MTPNAVSVVDTGLGSISGAGVGSAKVVEPASPIKTVPEPVSITLEPSPAEIPAGSSPVSAVSPLRVAKVVFHLVD